ncbi:TetR/AcrR family transcriptional regulator [Acaryochloris marina]|uniref:HTH tetR-type domain-containing protein n=1 Tax=Acaryochloris marina (strain MBIC 11017) TaxID=329726 RepID=A8ZKC7_ACAM1|nr:TetR/AcrR family transcriptional regulator [Acaryochloris marina]ABW31627.1 conserved hypothetical protein [Acaryochloris marina MBIC11017]
MKTDDNVLEVLRLFATYGFRKTSISDIAKAADLSRQSIYNQYGSKEAVLEWAVTTFLGNITDTVIHQLKTTDGEPAVVLSKSFQLWTGDHVPLLRGTPHGAEILDAAIISVAKASRNYEGEFVDAITTFLWLREVFPTKREAEETTFVLNLASKGLLLKSETSEAYALGMKRVIKALLG